MTRAGDGAPLDVKAPDVRARRLVHGLVFSVATCAIVYELALGTLASFTLGDAVTEFSITLGVYLSAMGAGAYASRKIEGAGIVAFVACELALAIAGGVSVPVMMHVDGAALRPALYGFIALVGVLVGVELPLLLRLQRELSGFDAAVAGTLALDYAGALVASIAFPFVAMPLLGLCRTTLLCGALNAMFALVASVALPLAKKKGALAIGSLLVAIALLVLFAQSDAWHLTPSE